MTVGLLALVICYVVLIYVLTGMVLLAMALAMTTGERLHVLLARKRWRDATRAFVVMIVLWPRVLKLALQS